MFSTCWMPFLLLNQQHQTYEGNKKHRLHPGQSPTGPHLILSWSISWFTRRTFALFVPVLLTSLATDDKTYHKCWIPYWHANEIIQQCLSEQLNPFWNLQQYLHVKFRTLIQIACACTSEQNTIQWQNFKDRHLMVEILPICHGNTLHF